MRFRHGLIGMAAVALVTSAAGADAQILHQRMSLGEPLSQALRLSDVHPYRHDCAGFRYPPLRRYRFGMGPDLRRLDRLATPVNVPAGVPVEAPLGVWAGRVRSVDIVQGRAKSVTIALNQCVTTRVKASEVRYDPAHRMAYVDVTRSQLWNLPSDRVVTYGGR
ncbi:MAG TPA: hypothetical protein VMU22_12470 [Rhizomicrobium sp.]|nr:hypothetical protein [Rhizomicrobium sp.]